MLRTMRSECARTFKWTAKVNGVYEWRTDTENWVYDCIVWLRFFVTMVIEKKHKFGVICFYQYSNFYHIYII